jgi:hypothetical protein
VTDPFVAESHGGPTVYQVVVPPLLGLLLEAAEAELAPEVAGAEVAVVLEFQMAIPEFVSSDVPVVHPHPVWPARTPAGPQGLANSEQGHHKVPVLLEP